jgi:hypothetical protein
VFAVAALRFEFKKLIFPVITVKSFEGTFAATPPPVRYLTLIVVFEGAIPYVFVKIKFVGE